MLQSNFLRYRKQVRAFFKELINRYKLEGYKEKIVPITTQDKFPTFQLRFIKKGNRCVYYRIVLWDKEIN